MNSFDRQYSNILNMIVYKLEHLPIFKTHSTTNYTCNSIRVNYFDKGWIYERYLYKKSNNEIVKFQTMYDLNNEKLIRKWNNKYNNKKDN